MIATEPKVHPALEADALTSAHFKTRYNFVSHVPGFVCLTSAFASHPASKHRVVVCRLFRHDL